MSPEPGDTHLTALLEGATHLTAEGVITSVVLLFLLLLLCAFFTVCENCFSSLSENRLEELAEEGDPKAKRLLKWMEFPARVSAALRLGTFLTGFFGVTVGLVEFAPWLTEKFLSFSWGNGLSLTVSVVLITLVLLYLFFVLGVLFPQKLLSQRDPEAAKMPHGFAFFLSLLWPLFLLMNGPAKLLSRLFGADPDKDSGPVTQEEILKIVDAGEEHGVIEESAKDMIENIMDFGDTVVSEIMTHRTDVIAIEDTETIPDVIELTLREGCSRIPLYHEDVDNILGIIYVKDLLKYVGQPDIESIPLTEIMRPANFIPEVKRCNELFTEMTERKIQMAVVCDEYGGTAGIVTMEDLLESIVGSIQDEYDNEEEEISQVNETTFTVDGTTALDEVSDLIGFDLPEGDYDTIAGMAVSILEYIPQPDEHPVVRVKNAVFTVLEVEDRRISKLLIEILPEEEEDSGEEESFSRKERD